ncbi:MAG: TonB-dependent receptor plug domain-containing protein [Deltaproteobacteria bacterium]|nr:TonB-dependent receptor plug domain-containing protein [Deltaproteobacteria bacterium]
MLPEFFIILILLTSSPKVDSLSSEDDTRITVKGKRFKSSRLVISKTKLDEEIKTNLASTLIDIPEIDILWSPKSGASIQASGFDERSFKIFVMGIPFSESYSGHLDISGTERGLFSRIEFSTGISSLLNGPSSAGGVLNLTPKSKCNKHSITGIFKTGNFNSLHPDFYTGLNGCSNYKNSHFNIAVSYNNTSGYTLPDKFKTDGIYAQYHEDGGVRNKSAARRFNLSFHSSHTLNSFNTIDFFSGYSSSPRQIPTFESSNYVRYWSFSEYSSLFAAAVWKKKFINTKLVNLNVSSFLHLHTDELIDHGDPSYSGITTDSLAWFAKSSYENFTAGISLMPEFRPWDDGSVIFKIQHKFDQHLQRELSVQSYIDGGSYDPWEKFHAQTSTAVFSYNHDLKFCVVNMESSISFMALTAREIKNVSYETMERKIPGTELRLKISRMWSSNILTELSVGKKIRYPTLKELFTNHLGGNPDLDAETAYMSDLSAVWKKTCGVSGFQIRTRLFHHLINNMITSYGDSFSNTGHSQISGGILSAAFKRKFIIGTPVVFQATGSFRELYTRDLDTNRPLDYRPSHSFKSSLTIKLPSFFTVSADLKWYSKQYAWWYDTVTSTWIKDILPNGLITSFLISAPVYKNAAVTISIFAQLTNALDTIYMSGSLEPRAGRTLFTGIKGKL